MIKSFRFDLILTKSSVRMYMVLFCAAIALSIFIKSSFGIAYMFTLAIIAACAPFSCESNTRITSFTNSLPIKKADRVKGRYMFLISMLAFVWFVSAIIVLAKYKAGSFEYANIISCFLAGITMTVLSLIQYPLYYRFGLMKGRLLNMAIYTLPIIIILALPQVTRDWVVSLLEPQSFGYAVLALAGLLTLVAIVSYHISKIVVVNKKA